jgi:CRP-like cAMP-binding protein
MDQPFQSPRNRLLALLAKDDLARLLPHLAELKLEYKDALYEQDRPIETVYFPITGVASLVNTMIDGSASEIGTIGNEGMVGLPILLGDTMASTSAYVQVPGSGLSMPSRALTEALSGSERMRAVFLRYVHAVFNQVSLSAACVHFHNLEQRCCRWLLMTHDRVQSDDFLLTHEFLGMMLGAQRPSVTMVARRLQRLKLIDYRRGQVTVLDRHGLERHSCECYAVGKREFDRLLGEPECAG